MPKNNPRNDQRTTLTWRRFLNYKILFSQYNARKYKKPKRSVMR